MIFQFEKCDFGLGYKDKNNHYTSKCIINSQKQYYFKQKTKPVCLPFSLYYYYFLGPMGNIISRVLLL